MEKRNNLGLKFIKTNNKEIIDDLECTILTFNLADMDTGKFANVDFTKKEISPQNNLYLCDYVAPHSRKYFEGFENSEQLKKAFEDVVLKDITRKISSLGALRKVELNAKFHEEKDKGYISIPENSGKIFYFPLSPAKEIVNWK
jgi:hypothetical protein